jgi:hypothetical protein
MQTCRSCGAENSELAQYCQGCDQLLPKTFAKPGMSAGQTGCLIGVVIVVALVVRSRLAARRRAAD